MTMSANVQDSSAKQKELSQFIWLWSKRAGITNGVLALLGISVALYVYCNFPIPVEIPHHGFNRYGEPAGPENALIYLFVFPCFQVWLVAIPLWGGWRTAHESADDQAKRDKLVANVRKFLPSVQPATPSANFYCVLLIILVLAEIGLLSATIVRAVAAALGST